MNTSDSYFIEKESSKKQYPEEVTKNAKLFGYKAANLLYLGRKLGKETSGVISEFDKKISGKSVSLLFPTQEDNRLSKQSLEPITVSIPKPICLSHHEIMQHLNNSFPKWKEDWENFLDAFNQQEDKGCLSSASAEILEKLGKKIKHAFDGMEIEGELDEQLSKLEKDAILMVRSTGAEDSPDLANPGGNKSVPSRSDKNSLRQAIGRVVASYFGKKSIEQRLKAQDDITKDPFMPVLIQPLIGEGLNGNDMVYSGVMYSGEGETRIQAAPGHGELVVNSQGNFDNFYVTSNKMVYSELQNKKFRIKPIFNEEKHKLSLIKEDNSKDIALFKRLDEEVIQEMHQVAQQIENLYKMRMDIEFVYTPSSKTLHIVQARALPEGDRVNHFPSALDPLYLGKILEEGGKQFEGRTITPDVNHAVIIEKREEIIVCDTIEEALQVYLQSDHIKAVVIRRNAPDTSHEAGVFTSKAIPVIQIRQIDQIESVVDELKKGKKLVIDPQRKSVFQLPLVPMETEILKEGFFKSSLTSHVTPYPHRFKQRIEGTDKLENSGREGIEEESSLLGDLFLAAKRGEPKAQKQLFSLVWEYFLKGNETKPSYKDLQSALKVLEDAYKESNLQMDALKTVVRSASLLYKKKKISYEVFVQVVISGFELHHIIKTLSSTSEKERVRREYLNVFEKLQGTLLGEGEEDVVASSMRIDLKETSHKKKAMEIIKDRQWSEEQRESFSEAIKLESFFIGEAGKQEWVEFCKKVCDHKDFAPRLASLVGTLVKLGIHVQWCNVSFPRIYQENSQEITKTLHAILKELKPILSEKKNLSEVDQSIDQLRKQLPLWKTPKNFEKLYEKLQFALDKIKEKLVFSQNDSLLKQMLISKQMQDFVEVFDLTVKSLKVSTFYEDKYLQAANFKVLITDFFKLMENWMKITNTYCPSITKFLSGELQNKKKPSPEDLSISGKFDVSSATIYSKYDNLGWVRTLKNCETLEDCFTLIHQNLLLLTNRVFSESGQILMNNCPNLVKSVNQVLSKKFVIRRHEQNTMQGSLSGISFDHPKITFHYNLPMRNHSSRMDIVYDYSKNKTNVDYHSFGENEQQRWMLSEFISLLKFTLSNVKLIKFPNFERAKNAFSFEIGIKSDKDIKILEDVIDDINYFSFVTSVPLWVISVTKTNLEEYETTYLNQFLDKTDNLKNKINLSNSSKFDKKYELEWLESQVLPLKFELERRQKGFDLVEFIHKNPHFLKLPDLNNNEELKIKLVDKYGLELADAISSFDNSIIVLRFLKFFKKEGEELSQKEVEKVHKLLSESWLLEAEDLSEICSCLDGKTISHILELESESESKSKTFIEALKLALEKFNEKI